MKYWQKKTKDLEILLIGLQSLIQSLNYFKRRKLYNNKMLNPIQTLVLRLYQKLQAYLAQHV